jgi:hypothetical protein
MGRISKRSETALKAADEILRTTKNQTIRAQMTKVVLDYQQHQQKRSDARKATRRTRAEQKEVVDLRSQVQELTDKLASKAKEILDLRSERQKAEQSVIELRAKVAQTKQELEKAHAHSDQLQQRLNFANQMIEGFAPGLRLEKLHEFAAELFQKLKTDQPELLGQFFKSMGLDLECWHSWDSDYGENSALMVRAFETPKGEHEPGKLPLLRLKLMAMGIPVDAINAVRDYRDLKITLTELKQRTHPYISFKKTSFQSLVIEYTISAELMPRLTEQALQNASSSMKSDPARKVDWLEVVEKLLKPDSGIGSLLSMELGATRRAVDESN